MLSLRTPLLFSCSLLAIASAQTPAEPVVKLDQLVVEGRLLTETPATVTVIPLETLPVTETTTAKLADRAPNFFIATNDAHSFTDIFSLRGLTNTPIFGDPAISFYLDDLPLGSGFTFPTDLVGFARAELHRGPTQNTVFGRAGSAGVLRVATPGLGAVPQGDLRVSYGNYNALDVAADVGSSSSGAVDAYVGADYASRDGYITNTKLNTDIDHKESTSGLARLRWRPSTTAELTLLVTALRARDGVQPLVPLGGPLFTVSRNSEGFTDLDAWNAALTAAFATPVGRLSATTSVNDWDLGPYRSTLGFGFAELVNNVDQKQHAWNEEVKLVSSDKEALRWQVGGFYSDGYTDGAFQRVFGPFPYEQSKSHVDARDLAGFGEATWALNPQVNLTAGLRLEQSRKTLHREETIPVPHNFDGEAESSAWLPKIGIDYVASRETTFFGTAGAGYKPGGFSTFTGNAALAPFGPERTMTLEAGVTHTLASKSLSVTARAFYYDITGYQIERSFATSSVADDYIVVNAPKARSWGGELELAWKPVDGLTIGVDVGATDVTLREFTDPYTHVSYAGNRAPAVPTYDASLRLDYESRLGFFVGFDITANGRTYYTEAEDLKFGQKAYA
ncbi:MAG TPA: TonB-dependent receptor, partial [Candidatus Didemnitutus sp.]|nr:TonB-dependent receptor [Candidatus Didemnitutus sp.]